MGTRHLIAVVLNQQFVLAQYGQWDGYPSGQGATILEFLGYEFERDKFVAGLQHLFEPTDAQIKGYYKDCGQTRTDGMVSMEVSERFAQKYPSLSRDTGAKILAIIQQNATAPLPTVKMPGFAGDSLWCEFAYVIDLDQNNLEVFKGFNTEGPTPPDSRFPSGADWLEKSDNTEYHPVKLVKAYPLNDLPSVEQLVKDVNGEDAEEADEAA